MREHPPSRPSWDCATCGGPWVCAAAKALLLKEFKGNMIGLAMYLGALLDEAIDVQVWDRDWDTVDDLFARFMGWLPHHVGGKAA